jgi:hypothetical protein
MRFRWLLPPILLLLILGSSFSFLVSSYFPEKLAFYLLQKTIRKSGGELTFGTIQGNIKKGLTLKKVSFQNDSVSLKAASVTLRLRTTPLVFGIFFLKELTVEGADAKIKYDNPSGKRPVNPIPLWLTVYSKNTSIIIDRLEVVDNAHGSFILENSKLESVFAVRLGRMSLKDVKLSVGKSPLGKPLAFSGSLGFKPAKWLNLDGYLSFGQSVAKAAASFNEKQDGPVFNAEIKEASIFLRDLAAFGDFPDLDLSCSAKVSGKGGHLKIKTDVEEKGYGKFSFDAEADIENGMIKGTGDVSAKPFYYSLGIPQVKSDRLRINGSFRSQFEYDMKNRKLKSELKGNIRDSEVLNLPIESGDAALSIEGKDLQIVSTFSSRVVGSGKVRVDYNFDTYLTSVEFSSEGTLSKSAVDALGIEIPLPYPLTFSENSLDISEGILLFDGKNIDIRIRAADKKSGTYFAGILFRNLEISDLVLDLTKIDPAMWGLSAPFKFSGNLDFNFAEPGVTTALLNKSSFEFEKGNLGPVDTTLKILPSGKLLIPQTHVPFAGGSADVAGELSEDGSYKGAGTAVLDSYDLAPPEIRDSFKGVLSSSFDFDGNFSRINIAGVVRSGLFKYDDSEIENVEVTGRAHIETGKTSLDLDLLSEAISSKVLSTGRTSIKLNGPLTGLRFELSSQLDEKNVLTLGGMLNLGTSEFSSKIENGTLKTGERNLYFSGSPEISYKENALTWSGVTLLSGESKLFSDGTLALSKETRSIDAKLTIENFSIVLLPLPEEMASLRGKIDGSLTIKGPFDEPDFEGELLFKNLTFPLKDSDFKIIGMANLKFEKDMIDFSNCYFSTNDGGDSTLTGKVKMKGFYPEVIDLSLNAQDFPVIYGKDFQGFVDIGLKLTGNYDEPHLEGNVHFLKGKIQLPEAAKNPALPASITFINQPGPKKKLSPEESSFLARLRGGVLFTSKGKLWISRNDMVGELGGRVIVKFTRDGIVPEGNLTILGGRFLLQGTKFELKDSSLYFSGGKDLYPILDIKASKDIGDYEVTVRLQGRVEKPTLTFSSVPPLDEGEILSLILFGRPSQNLSPEEHARWGGAAAAIAFNYEATPIIRSVTKALKVDTLLVGTSSVGDPQLGFSKYLSDRFVLEYEQVFGSLPESRVNLRYRINRHLSLETISSTAGKSGADLTWEQKY